MSVPMPTSAVEPFPLVCLADPCACGSEEECGCVPSALLAANGKHFCVNCVAPLDRQCPQCGCTDTYGCMQGCSWVAGEVDCSACLE